MMRAWRDRWRWLFLCLFWSAGSTAFCSEEKPIPAGAKIAIKFDRAEYLLGENVLLQFVIENTAKELFTVNFGGDYRGIDRSLRFKVTAVDSDGKAAADPDPDPNYMGGIVADHEVLPGQVLTISLPLSRYRKIDYPGRYVVRASHDLGWKGKAPIADTSVIFREPTAQEAEAVVAKMESLPDDDDNHNFGMKSPDYADFRCLHYPVYFAPLQSRADRGDLRALEGLDGVPSMETTQFLIELAAAKDTKVRAAAAAAAAVSGRLPIPDLVDGPIRRWELTAGKWKKRDELVRRSWDAQLTEKVRALARRLLASDQPTLVVEGAQMIHSIGTPEDAPAALKAIDYALNTTMRPRRNPSDNVLDFPVPLPELLCAMHALDVRGYGKQEGISGSSGTLAYFQYWNRKTPERPPDFAQMIQDFGPDSSYPVRQLALESIPTPLTPDYFLSINRGLADEDFGVCRIACAVAGKSGNRGFLKPILEIVASENEPWLLREACQQAKALGGEWELWNVVAERLPNLELTGIALDSLQAVFTGLPGSSGGRTDLTRGERLAMRDAWRTFLSEHEGDLSVGRRFKAGDPSIPPALFGRARAWTLADGKSWP